MGSVRLPSRNCSHAYGMLFENDYCCCSKCEQEWTLGKYGWKPLVGGIEYESQVRAKGSFRAKQKPIKIKRRR